MEREYRELKARWIVGERDRETGLKLMFFAWMHEADPNFVTGFTNDPEAIPLWHELFKWFGGLKSDDTEFLHCAGLMARLFPYVLGEEDTWVRNASLLEERARRLRPEGFTASYFEGRGDFGDYFAHQNRASAIYRAKLH